MNPAVPEASLIALLHLLAEQALLAMGVPHPLITEPPPPNEQAARFYVDCIGVLKDRTEGHRTPEESRQFDEVLYQLRMRIMDLKPASSPPPGPQA